MAIGEGELLNANPTVYEIKDVKKGARKWSIEEELDDSKPDAFDAEEVFGTCHVFHMMRMPGMKAKTL